MGDHILHETFAGPNLDERLGWYCPPQKWRFEDSRLVIEPEAQTDYWQQTHYGFRADNGHFLYLVQEDDFVLSTRLRFYPANQYDQAGLMVRLSPQCWLKTSVEYEPHGPGRLGAVVTNHGYSDWSTQDYEAMTNDVAFRIKREGDDYLVTCTIGTSSKDEAGAWTQIRLAHLHNADKSPVQCGLYACSPIDAGFRAEFYYLSVERI